MAVSPSNFHKRQFSLVKDLRKVIGGEIGEVIGGVIGGVR